MKEYREKYGLSQQDIVRNLGYCDKASISNLEKLEEINTRYMSSLKILCEVMELTTEKINKFELQEPAFLVAKKEGFVRRIYSFDNEKAMNSLAILLNRIVIYRPKEIYKYEIIIF